MTFIFMPTVCTKRMPLETLYRKEWKNGKPFSTCCRIKAVLMNACEICTTSTQ